MIAPRIATAQNADAEALFSEADRLESKGRLDEACDAFEASNRIEARAGTMIRIGQCRERQGRLASAWSAYKDALTRAKDPVKRRIAEAALGSIEPRLSYLTVLVPDANRVDGLVLTRNDRELDPALWNRAAPVDGGVYTVSGRAPGHETWATTVEVAVDGDHTSVEVPRFKELRALVVPGGDAGGDAIDTGKIDAHDDDDNDTASSRWTGRRKVALGLAAGGVIALGAAGVLGLQSQSLEDRANALCPDAQGCASYLEARDAHGRAASRALGANIAGATGVAVLAGAAFLWFTGAPRAASSRTAWRPAAGPSFSGIDVTVRF
ncbi:MAG TPA: hypothetical protein VM261_16810 [Kofleriaceae bacterium]|nr:hypothetical protein [Kofleriaceae bacterium]